MKNVRILKGKPSAKNFMNKGKKSIAANWKEWHHESTNYDVIAGAIVNEFGYNSSEYLTFKREFGYEVAATMTNKKIAHFIRDWALMVTDRAGKPI